jgi:hypothetical protein
MHTIGNLQTDQCKLGNMMRTMTIRLIVLGVALAACLTAQAEDSATAAAEPAQKSDRNSERPKGVFVDGFYHEPGVSRGSATAPSRGNDPNFYAGLGRQGDAPLGEVYAPPPPPKPTCHYSEVMSDEELELCKSAARGSQ